MDRKLGDRNRYLKQLRILSFSGILVIACRCYGQTVAVDIKSKITKEF